MDGEELVESFPSLFTPEAMPLPWTESPFLAQLLERSELTTEDRAMVETFARDGFVVLDAQLPTHLLEAVDDELAGRHPVGAAGRPDRLQDAWTFSGAVKQVASHPPILRALETLYRRQPIPFQTLNFEVGTEQRTHSDTIHFQTHPENWMCGVWVALEEIDAGNGPLHYYPGSHRERLYDMGDLDLPSDYGAYLSYEDFIEALASARGWERRTVTVPRGAALVWAANLLHGGEPITEPGRSRRTQVTHYYFGGCTYYTPMSSDVFLGRVAFRTDTRDIRTGVALVHSYKGHTFKPQPSAFPAIVPARVSGTSGSVAYADVAPTWHRWVPPALAPFGRRLARRARAIRGVS